MTLLVFLRSCHPFSYFNPSPNSSIGVPGLSPIVGSKYFHMSQSAAGVASQKTAIIGSCKHNIASIRVSGFVACLWDRSQVGLVIGQPFLQSLLHFCLCISFRQEPFWVKMFEGRLVPPSVHWGACLNTAGVLFRFHLSIIGHFC